MSRITETTNATIRTEAVSPRITIHWNPVDDSGFIQFQTSRMEFINDEFVRLLPEDDLTISIEDFMQRPVMVAGQEVQPELVAGYIKALFDGLYVERSTPTDPEPAGG